MTTTTIRVDANLLFRVEQVKPSYLSTAGFFQLLAEQALNDQLDKNALSPLTIPPYPTTSQSSESFDDEETGVEGVKLKERKRLELLGGEGEDINVPLSQGKPIDPELEQHCDLIRDFWRTKKGSKGDRAWQLLMTGLKAIKLNYGNSVVDEQLQLAINGRWASVTLANYERFKPADQPKKARPKLSEEELDRLHAERVKSWGLV